MFIAMLEWLAAPYLGLAAVTYVAWLALRGHTHREIDRDYEKLCLETGKDTW